MGSRTPMAFVGVIVLVTAVLPSVAASAGAITCNGLAATIVADGTNPVLGTDGDDVIVGTADRDVIYSGKGRDTICSLGGNDVIRGAQGHDWIDAGDGNDVINGGGGDDYINGGEGRDTIRDSHGDDSSVNGGPGNDRFVVGKGTNFFDGGDGLDRIDYRAASEAVSVNLATRSATARVVSDSFTNIEQVKGSRFGDLLQGDSGPNILIGWLGDDDIDGRGGDDNLLGDAGDDLLDGGYGRDRLNGGFGTDTCTGEKLRSCELEPTTAIGSVWANDGGDKVLRDELRATADPSSVLNSVWDGTTVTLFGARNEVVAFNLILEAPATPAAKVKVRLTGLDGPGDARIGTRPTTGNGVFDYVGRNIELFYVRYLEIEGLSVLSYETYDERHIPEDCRRSHTDGEAAPGTGWDDRPCHNRLYPDIAVPMELENPFNIPADANQSIWGDITIPADTPPGRYDGTIQILEEGTVTHQIPIRLEVRDFALPDLPTARTMAFYSEENINERYFGDPYIAPGDPRRTEAIAIQDRHFQLAHRHRTSLIDDYQGPARLDEAWGDRLDGDLFTPVRGYEGPGEGVGNNVYSIGTYASWPWFDGTRRQMWNNTDTWVTWFDDHPFTTPTDYFLYLIDESDDFAQIEQWSTWIDDNPGPGSRLPSMATVAVTDAVDEMPSLDIPASGSGIGLTNAWQTAADAVLADPGRQLFMYNGTRPATGSLATEDEGIALRQLAWTQYKKGIDRWFVWETTYYDNFQCYGDGPEAATNVFRQAQTFGCDDGFDPVLGHTGWNYNNGDGVLFYPGTDLLYPTDSYGVDGPFASLRLKHWRRGIQDVEYLALAAAVDPVRTRQIVEGMIPQVLWEYGVDDPGDPTWVWTDISWSADPDDWEAARAELADIIEGG